MPKTTEQNRIVCTSKLEAEVSGVARNLIWGVYVLTSHCNFKSFGNVPHVNKTVTDFGGIYTDIPPVATPLAEVTNNKKKLRSAWGIVLLCYWCYEANCWQTRSIVRPLCDSRATCIVCSDKSVAYVANNKRLRWVRSSFCTIEANYWQTRNITRHLCESTASCVVCRNTLVLFYFFEKCLSHIEEVRHNTGRQR